ncbi:MAG: hypothetical protein ACREX4_17045 [Gammaproteobacteria bacterium]
MNSATFRGSAHNVAPQVLALIFALLLAGACGQVPRDEAHPPTGAQSRAEELLVALRRADWSTATRFVYLHGNTRARMGIASSVGSVEAGPQIEAWFRTLYGTVRPGSVHSVTIDPSDPTRARVSYRHEDLDAFTMRFVNGDWFYVVE